MFITDQEIEERVQSAKRSMQKAKFTKWWLSIKKNRIDLIVRFQTEKSELSDMTFPFIW